MSLTNEWISTDSDFFESFRCWKAPIDIGYENIDQVVRNLAKQTPILIKFGNLYFTEFSIMREKRFRMILEEDPEELVLNVKRPRDLPIVRDLAKSALNRTITASGASSLFKQGNRVHFFRNSTYVLEAVKPKGVFRAIRGFSSIIWYDNQFHRLSINFTPDWIYNVEVFNKLWTDWIGEVVFVSSSDSHFRGGAFRLISVDERNNIATVQRGEKRYDIPLQNLNARITNDLIQRERLSKSFKSFVRYERNDEIEMAKHMQKFFESISESGVLDLKFSALHSGLVAFKHVTTNELLGRIAEKLDEPSVISAENAKITDVKKLADDSILKPSEVPYSAAVKIKPLLLFDRQNESKRAMNVLNEISKVSNDVFGVPFEISDERYYDTLGSAIDAIQTIRTSSLGHPCVFFVLMRRKESLCGFYHKMKVELIKQALHSQFVSLDTIARIESHPIESRAMLANIALGIMTQSGMIPWVLAEPLSNIAGILSLNRITSRSESTRETHQSDIIGLMKNNGFWLENGIRIGPTFAATADASEKESTYMVVSDSIEQVIKQSNNSEIRKKPLILHTSYAYSEQDLDLIEKSIVNQGFKTYKILRILDNSRFRYFLNGQETSSNGMQGYYGFLYPGKISFLYTLQKKYEGPIEIELLRGTSQITREDLNDIYKLTKLRYSSLSGRSYRLPVSITLLKKVADFARCGLEGINLSPSFFL